MTTVDLVYDVECPNVAAARANLARAFADAGLAPHWQEHRIGDPDNPARVRGYGSPTILVDSRDVSGDAPGAEACCRLYGGSVRAPTVETIADALRAAAPRQAVTDPRSS